MVKYKRGTRLIQIRLPGDMHAMGLGTLNDGDRAATKILFLVARFQDFRRNAIDVVGRRRGSL